MTNIFKESGLLFFLLVTAWIPVNAGEVKILAAQLNRLHDNQWTISVTLKHQDSGWEHYADNWRVVDSSDAAIGNRVLHHPHVNEQPFTRSLTNIEIPAASRLLYIEARDNVHGWSGDRLKIDLSKALNGRLSVTANADK
ncbi:hypothetical protein [Amphritea sp. HPY]|uniref:hypothetical protein n=1 Tax=Amphritea sp. HPY TaxID=3421652 RepID=UPI003D7D287F